MAKASVAITAANKLPEGLGSAKRSIDEFQQYAEKVGNKLNKAFSMATVAAAAIGAIKGISNAVKKCVQEFSEAEKVTRRLEAVWANVGTATNKTASQMNALAEALEKETYFSAESIKEAGLLLAATESLTEEGFERALEASLDLAAALGEDVASAAQTLSKAIQEPEASLSRLKTIGVTFTEQEKDQIKALTEANELYEAQAIILDKVEQKYKDIAKAINDTPIGTIDNIKDVLADIRKELGKSIVNEFSPFLQDLYEDLLKIYNLIRTDIPQEGGYSVSKDLVRYLGDLGMTEAQIMSGNWERDKHGYNHSQSLLNDIYKEIEKTGISWENLEDLLKTYQKALEGKEGSWSWWDYSFGTSDSYSKAFADYMGLYTLLQDAKISGKYVPTAKVAAPAEEGAASAIVGAVTTAVEETTSAFADFLDSYGKNSETYLKAQYQQVIDYAQGLLDKITQAVPTSLSEMRDLLGLDETATGSDIKAAIEEGNYVEILQQIIDAFTAKINPPTPTAEPEPEVIEPSVLEQILEKYGKQSSSYLVDTLKAAYNQIAEVYGSQFEFLSEDQRTYLREILAGIEEQYTELLDQGKTEDKVLSFMDKIQNNLSEKIGQMFGATSGQSSNFLGSAFSSMTSSFGEAGEVISTLAQNMATMGPVLGAIATALKYVFEGLSQVIGPVLNDFIAYGIEPLRELGRAIGEIILPLMQDIMPMVKESAEVLGGIFNALAVILKPIVSFLSSFIIPIIMQITALLETLEPILEIIADVVLALSTVFEWVGQGMRHIFAVIANWLASIEAFGWHPFGGLAMEDPGAPGSINDMYAANMAKVHAGFDSGYLVDSISTNQAISSAAYRGATSVTINIYAEGPIVGDGGMRQFAALIRDEFDALDYYGVN